MTYGVGPKQIFDFMSHCLKNEACFGLRMAILGLKLPLLGISGRQERKGVMSFKNLKFVIALILAVKMVI